MRTLITAELREYAGNLANRKVDDYDPAIIAQILNAHADRIDREHRRRMDDCRRNTRHDAIRYMRGVLNDYDHDIKRVRKGDAVEVVRCRDCRWSCELDGRTVCHLRPPIQHYVADDGYCDKGERREVTT